MIVERINDNAKLPTKAHHGDLGYDLYSAQSEQIIPGDTKLISTGIRVRFPDGYGAKIFDRSSVATKQNLTVVAGVIDNGYRGEIKIALHNAGRYIQTVYVGDKIAQMVLLPTVDFAVEEGKVDENETTRGAGGFGSTGK